MNIPINTHLQDINYLAVLSAAAASFALGGLWFSPFVFGKSWMAEMKLRPEDCKDKKGKGMMFVGAFLLSLFASFVLAVMLNEAKANGPALGAVLGLIMGVGLVATSVATNYIFESKSFRLFYITAGHHIATFVVMGAILGAWR